jgi:hypothetical protein
MSSSAWADALLVVILLAPLGAVVLAMAAAVPDDDHRWTSGACGVAAAGALALLLAGQRPHVNRLAPDDLALAAATGTALLALALDRRSRTPVVAATVTLVVCGVAAGAPGNPSTVGPILAIAAAVLLLAVSRESTRLGTGVLCAGVLAAAAGTRAGGHSGVTAVVLGAAAVGVVASIAPRRSTTLLAPIALVVGLHAGSHLAGTSNARWLAVVLGLAGAALVAVPRFVSRFAWASPVAALVPWTLAAAVGPLSGASFAARPLAAGVVIALALGGPLALLASLPGAAMLAYAIADGQGWARPALAALLIATVFGVTAVARAETVTRVKVRAVDAIVMLAGAWFVARPTAWTFARVEGLRAYTDGAALAVAAALITGVAVAASGYALAVEAATPWLLVEAEPAAPNEGSLPPSRVEVIAIAAAALTGLVVVALVRSARL